MSQVKGGKSIEERLVLLEEKMDMVYDKLFPQANVMGMVLVEEGGNVNSDGIGTGTWVRVNQAFETIDFDPTHGTWAGMKTVMDDTYGEFVEIPITYVKTEVLKKGPYKGKTCYWIADGPLDGFHVHSAFIGDDGEPHVLQISSFLASKKRDFSKLSSSEFYELFSEDMGTSSNASYYSETPGYFCDTPGWFNKSRLPIDISFYNVFQHHFLARLMLTEYGTPDSSNWIINGTSYNDITRFNYHGIYDPVGFGFNGIWLFGLNLTDSGCKITFAGDAIQTNILSTTTSNESVIVSCFIEQDNGIEFGDLFIKNKGATSENKDKGNFGTYQVLNKNNVYYSNKNIFLIYCSSSGVVNGLDNYTRIVRYKTE